MDAQSGVEPQTENVWRQATTYGVPRIVFINKMDKIGANFDYSVSTIKDRLQANPLPVQMPIGAEDQFEGVIDLVEMQADLYDEDASGASWETVDVPEEYLEEAQTRREEMIEALADVNGYIQEYVSGQRVIKAFNKEDDVKYEFNIRNENLRKNGFMAQTVAGMVMPIMGNISNISTAITTILAGIFCINGKITLGTITIFSKFSKEYSRPITEIANQFNVIQAGIAGAERIFEIIDEEEEYPENVGKPEIGKLEGHVEFKNVYFGYKENENILKDIKEAIAKINENMPPYKHIRDVIVTSEELIKTTTAKVKRHEEIAKILGENK